MTYTNFWDEVDSVIYGRGTMLHDCEAVTSLHPLSPWLWQARVRGSELYTVMVKVGPDQILNHQCDCPYDWGPVCKHVVATVLAIEEIVESRGAGTVNVLEGATEPTDAPETFDLPKELAKISQGLERQDLLDFITEACAADYAVFEAFKLHFAGRSQELPKPDYRDFIAQAVSKAEGEWGFIEAHHLEEIIAKLNQRADQQYESEKWEEVQEICSAIMHEIPPHLESISDDAQEVGIELNRTWQIQMRLLHASASEPLKEAIKADFVRYFVEFPNRWGGLEHEIWQVLMATELTESQQTEIRQLIEDQLHDLKLGLDYLHWETVHWLKRLREFLIHTGKASEVAAALTPYLHLAEIREIFVDAEIAAKRYYKAKELIREGMRQKAEHAWHGEAKPWRGKLLEIAQLEDDVLDIRVHARELFSEHGHEMKYYDLLKSTYSPDKWATEVEKIIKRMIGEPHQIGIYNVGPIAEVLARERHHARLLHLLQQFPGELDLLDKFFSFLEPVYPQEVLQLFSDSIRAYAEANTGRSSYRYLTKMLRSLTKRPGGPELATELLQELRQQYRRRRAMMEILLTAFPQDPET
ncbi:MAG: hypothetical protein AAF998_17160 [Bacteroidota bacterium]